ncbi:hypothetical protein, partial [Sphingobacterium hotanense]|uniref:hypothetical protein n=1 Tax=Sphingobacterium hotanense TaxID=649196 RepID=UPI0021A2AD56
TYQSSVTLRQDRVNNVKLIEIFIKKQDVTGVTDSINLLKLGAKHNLLVNAESMTVIKEWKEVFPEANLAIFKSHYSWLYKILGWSIINDFWLVPSIWTRLKKIYKNCK